MWKVSNVVDSSSVYTIIFETQRTCMVFYVCVCVYVFSAEILCFSFNLREYFIQVLLFSTCEYHSNCAII